MGRCMAATGNTWGGRAGKVCELGLWSGLPSRAAEAWRVAGWQLRGKRLFLFFPAGSERKPGAGRRADSPSGSWSGIRDAGRKAMYGQAEACWSWGTAAQPGESGQAGHTGFLCHPPLAATPLWSCPQNSWLQSALPGWQPCGWGRGLWGQGSVASGLSDPLVSTCDRPTESEACAQGPGSVGVTLTLTQGFKLQLSHGSES